MVCQAPVPGQGDRLLRLDQGPPHLPCNAHTLRERALDGLGSPATGGHPGLHLGHLGITGAACLGRARWGAHSKQRPHLAGARMRAGGVGASWSMNIRCTSCRSPSAESNIACGTACVATPRVGWRRGAPSLSVAGGGGGMMAPPGCGLPPQSCTSGCYAAPWPRLCGRRGGSLATACQKNPACPHCGAVHEDDVYVLWD